MIRSFIISALLATSTQAVANGWDDSWELSEWSVETLLWAQAVHPKAPSVDAIEAVVPPPPEELWCIEPTVPEDCGIWETMMDEWLHRFLGLKQNQLLPANLPAYPKACPSTCEVF